MVFAWPSWHPIELRWPTISTDLAGIFLLADTSTLAIKTALSGRPSYIDALTMLPGLHQQVQAASELHKGEYPACAAMTSGYVFRVENPATVYFLQRIGRPGILTTLNVEGATETRRVGFASRLDSARPISPGPGYGPTLVEVGPAFVTVLALSSLVQLGDWCALAVVISLVLLRLLNIIVLRRRTVPGWSGAPEPGVKGDLLVLLSQDRWVRIRGLVDDIKPIVSGAWLRDATTLERIITACTTYMLYLTIILFASASQAGHLHLLALLLVSTLITSITNEGIQTLQMYGRVVRVGKTKRYDRRLIMAEELIAEVGRKDWAIQLGMVHAETRQESDRNSQPKGPLIM